MARTMQAGKATRTLSKGARITGDQRDALAVQLAARYAAGESIRSIADDTGRSYGFVHGVLKESGAELRGRGGATRGPSRKAMPTPSRGRRRSAAAETADVTETAAVTAPAEADQVGAKKSKKKPPAKADAKVKAAKPAKADAKADAKAGKKSGRKGSKKG